MSVGAFTLATAPLLPWTAVAALGAVCALVLGFGLLRRAPGLPWRAVAFAILLAALVNPSVVEEQRLPQRDIAIVVVDESPSQRIGDRQHATETALATLKDRLAQERGLDLRVIRAGKPQPGAGDDGTRLFAALDRAMSEVPRQRLAGIVMITDGQVHDVPSGDAKALNEAIGAPLHVLLSGQPDEGDRRLVVDQAPSFGLVGKELKLTIRVEDLPQASAQKQDKGATSQAKVTWRKDGGPPHPIMVPVDRDVKLPVQVARRDERELIMRVAGGAAELARAESERIRAGGIGRERIRVGSVGRDAGAGQHERYDRRRAGERQPGAADRIGGSGKPVVHDVAGTDEHAGRR